MAIVFILVVIKMVKFHFSFFFMSFFSYDQREGWSSSESLRKGDDDDTTTNGHEKDEGGRWTTTTTCFLRTVNCADGLAPQRCTNRGLIRSPGESDAITFLYGGRIRTIRKDDADA